MVFVGMNDTGRLYFYRRPFVGKGGLLTVILIRPYHFRKIVLMKL